MQSKHNNDLYLIILNSAKQTNRKGQRLSDSLSSKALAMLHLNALDGSPTPHLHLPSKHTHTHTYKNTNWSYIKKSNTGTGDPLIGKMFLRRPIFKMQFGEKDASSQ